MSLSFFQLSDPIPIKKSKHEDFPSQSPLADKEKQHDWLSASNKVSVAKLVEEMMMKMMMMHGAWDEMPCNIIQRFSDEGIA